LRVAVKHTYSLQEVLGSLQSHITVDANQPLSTDDEPKQSLYTAVHHLVPKYLSLRSWYFVVMRAAKSGPNQGKRFWGCSNYPKCKMRPIRRIKVKKITQSLFKFNEAK